MNFFVKDLDFLRRSKNCDVLKFLVSAAVANVSLETDKEVVKDQKEKH